MEYHGPQNLHCKDRRVRWSVLQGWAEVLYSHVILAPSWLHRWPARLRQTQWMSCYWPQGFSQNPWNPKVGRFGRPSGIIVCRKTDAFENDLLHSFFCCQATYSIWLYLEVLCSFCWTLELQDFVCQCHVFVDISSRPARMGSGIQEWLCKP